MKVLSLFDGMSCGYLALKKSGFKVDAYLASEITEHAIKTSTANNPDIIHVGDVTKLSADEVERKAGGNIDLIIGGSPCQDLSGIGSRQGLEGHKSRLFFEYFRLVDELKTRNPKLKFLLENVVPRNKIWEDEISNTLGCEPVLINSSVLMPYSRPRMYWANFEITQPTPIQTTFADYIDFTSTENTLGEGWHKWWEKNKEFQIKKQYSRVVHPGDQGICMTARQYASWNGNFIPTPEGKFRKPTKRELALLVGAPVNYFDCVTQRQAEEMTGNGWTIPVITHIFNCLNNVSLSAAA